MMITFSKDGAPSRYVPAALCLSFFRAFRAELWRAGIKRDPQTGDTLLGVTITSLTL